MMAPESLQMWSNGISTNFYKFSNFLGTNLIKAPYIDAP